MAAQDPWFCLFIVESQSADEYARGEGEAALVRQAAEGVGVKAEAFIVRDEDDLQIALSTKMSEFVRAQGVQPVLHISCHGEMDYLKLMDGTELRWADAARYLRALNRRLEGNVLLSVSACHALNGAAQLFKLASAKAVVAPREKPTWDQTKTAYSAFYKALAAGGNQVWPAVRAMNAELGFVHPGSWLFYAQLETTEVRIERLASGVVESFAERLSFEDLRFELNDPYFFTSPRLLTGPEQVGEVG